MKTRGLGTIGAALAAATLLLGTTAASTAAAPTAIAAGHYSTPAMRDTSIDSRYLAVMHRLDLGPVLSGTDDALVYSARSFCDNGADVSDIDKVSADDIQNMFGMDKASLRNVFRIMAAYYCPDLIGNVG